MNAKEINFAYKVRRALNEQAESLPAPTLDRLAQARKAALQVRKQEAPRRVAAWVPAFAQSGFNLDGFGSWFSRAAMAVPAIVMVFGILALYQAESQQRIDDVAEIDVMVLTDELPLTAYLDKGFNGYLVKRAE